MVRSRYPPPGPKRQEAISTLIVPQTKSGVGGNVALGVGVMLGVGVSVGVWVAVGV